MKGNYVQEVLRNLLPVEIWNPVSQGEEVL